jgi:hypothetical protein
VEIGDSVTDRAQVETRTTTAHFMPVLVAGVLLLALWLAGQRIFTVEQSDRDEAISAALSSIPSRLSFDTAIWIKQRDVQIPTRQAEIFGLTASYSAEYRRTREFPSLKAVVFIAYCSDARTMVGHHPPRCYPASGWLMAEPKPDDDFEFARADGRLILGTTYRFVREGVITAELEVANGFFAAGDRFFRSLGDARKVVKPALLGGKGLFQFQILFQGNRPNDDVLGYVSEIINAIPDVIFDELMLVPAGSVEVQAVELGGNA